MYKSKINAVKKMEDGIFIISMDEIYIDVGKDNNKIENIM
jgi:hypothetical protein